MASEIEKKAKLERESRRIQFSMNLWTRIARITRWGIHGFVLWRVRQACERAVKFNERAIAFNRRANKERRRERHFRNNH